jgi:hypothetical protein
MARGRPGRKREREFLSQLKASLLERNCWFYKIPDMPHFEGAQFRFDIPKPFDGFGIFAGQPFVIEAKVITRFKKLSLKDLRPCQIEGLEHWHKRGGKAFVFYRLWQATQSEHAKSAIHRLYVIPWERMRGGEPISKAELITLPYFSRYPVKTDSGNTTYRFNVDSFLIDLIMREL